MNKKSFTLQQLATLIGAEVTGDPGHLIFGIADLDSATSEEVSFFSNPRYEQKLLETKAGAVVVTQEYSTRSQRALVVTDPTAAFQKLIELFMAHLPKGTGFEDGIHASAVIHKTATIEVGVNIGPNVVVGANAIIRQGTNILPGTVIGASVEIGNSCQIHSQVVIREGTIIGNRVVIQPGVVIGSCGYGFATDKSGKHTKLNQLGAVVIHDDVEIGANTTIDRARFQATTIGEGTKIDNLVQIAHGVTIGKHCLIVGQVGIAGSTKIGNYVIIGGQTGIAGHIEIADHVAIAARSGVSKSLLKAGKYGGHPAIEFSQNQRLQVFVRQIEKLKEEIEKLKTLLR